MKEKLYLFNRLGDDYYIYVNDGNTSVAILYIPTDYVQIEEYTTINTDFFTLKESIASIEFPLKDTAIVEVDEFTYALQPTKGINTFYFCVEGQKGTKIERIRPQPIMTLDSEFYRDGGGIVVGKFISVDAETIIVDWIHKGKATDLDYEGSSVLSFDERIETEFLYPIYYG